MIKIAIVEDSEFDLALLQTEIEKFFTEKKISFEITHYNDSAPFIDDFKCQYNLIFMDIELPSKNGMDTARHIRTLDIDVGIVFLTNLTQYAIHGYEVDALDYILKPISTYSFNLKMPKILQHITHNRDKQITLVIKNKIHPFMTSELYYVEVSSHQLYYHTLYGTFSVRGSMQSVVDELTPYRFSRCNNCYLVNLRHVQFVEGNNVIVGGDTLSISRPRKKDFINELTNFLGGELK